MAVYSADSIVNGAWERLQNAKKALDSVPQFFAVRSCEGGQGLTSTRVKAPIPDVIDSKGRSVPGCAYQPGDVIKTSAQGFAYSEKESATVPNPRYKALSQDVDRLAKELKDIEKQQAQKAKQAKDKEQNAIAEQRIEDKKKPFQLLAKQACEVQSSFHDANQQAMSNNTAINNTWLGLYKKCQDLRAQASKPVTFDDLEREKKSMNTPAGKKEGRPKGSKRAQGKKLGKPRGR
jgi:hypothetical protein